MTIYIVAHWQNGPLSDTTRRLLAAGCRQMQWRQSRAGLLLVAQS